MLKPRRPTLEAVLVAHLAGTLTPKQRAALLWLPEIDHRDSAEYDAPHISSLLALSEVEPLDSVRVRIAGEGHRFTCNGISSFGRLVRILATRELRK